jgi:hypothetical protein
MKEEMKHLHFMKATIISAVVLFALPAFAEQAPISSRVYWGDTHNHNH